MNIEDCIGEEFYWVLVEFYSEKPEYQIAWYEYDATFGQYFWTLCGTDESVKYYPDDVPPYERMWISKIISHVERPPYNDEDFNHIGTTYKDE